jgi:hypothetical protein
MKKDIFNDMNDEPIYYLEIDENVESAGLGAISFVDEPATKTTWFKFNEEDESFNFKFEKNEMKRIVTGPVMLAETPIKRKGENGDIFWVKFSADTIFKMRNKYFKENKIHNINENHNQNKVVENVYMVESFMIDEKTQTNLYPDIPVGTWMASFYVEDENYWNDVIMKDNFNGFSLEGNFKTIKEDEEKKKKNKNYMNKMEILNKVKELFSTHKENNMEETAMFIDVKTESGMILRISEMVIGGSVKEVTEGGEMDVEPGDYMIDGIIITVEEGLISNIVESETEEENDENIEPVEPVEPEQEMKSEVENKPKKIVEQHTQTIEFNELKELIVENFEKIKGELKDLKSENEKLKSRFEKFSQEPSAEPIKQNKFVGGMSKEDKLKFFGKKK